MGVALPAAVERDLVGVLEAVAAGRRPREAARALLALVRAKPRAARQRPTVQLWLFRVDADCAPWWADRTSPFRIASAAGALRPDDLVACSHYHCRLLVRVCVQRQIAKWPGGNRCADGSVKAKRAGIHAFCFSGACQEGKDHRERSGYQPEVEWSKGAFSFFRPGSGEQRRRRRELLLSTPEVTPDLDHPPGSIETGPAVDLEDEDVRDILTGRG